MAYPFQQSEGLTEEQVQTLRELNSFKLISDSDAWKKIVLRIKANVEEAMEEMLGCPPDTSMEGRGVLQLRWQQREAIYRDLTSFMASQLNAREQIIEEIKEQTNDASSDPGSNDQ